MRHSLPYSLRNFNKVLSCCELCNDEIKNQKTPTFKFWGLRYALSLYLPISFRTCIENPFLNLIKTFSLHSIVVTHKIYHLSKSSRILHHPLSNHLSFNTSRATTITFSLLFSHSINNTVLVLLEKLFGHWMEVMTTCFDVILSQFGAN